MKAAMAGEAPAPFDVVVVPDFTGERLLLFEARTLFFLASWIERAGAARGRCPLHLACIGEPPGSVAALAEDAGASVTVHPPKDILPGVFDNKQVCFDVKGRTGQLLYVDADVLVLGDPSPLGELAGSFAAAVWGGGRIPQEVWSAVLSRLATPTANGAEAAPRSPADAPVQFFNGGVFWCPWDSPVAATWQDHMRRIEGFRESLGEPYSSWREFHGDEVSLATAFHVLKLGGFPCRELPLRFNAHWRCIAAGKVAFEDISLLHATRLLKPLEGRGALERSVRTECKRAASKMLKRWGILRHPVSLLSFLPEVKKLRAFQGYFRGLYRNHVLRALERSGRRGLFE